MIKIIKKIFVPEKIALTSGKEVKPPKSMMPYIILILAVVTFLSVRVTGFSLATIIKRGGQFWVIVKAMFPPNWSYFDGIISFLLDTVIMSFLGSMLGSILALPFAALCASNINDNIVLRQVLRFIFSILRTVPTLIIALIATYIFGIGTFVGTLAIGIFTFGIVVKMLYENIETVDMGAFEAMESLGSTKFEAFITAIMPQILPTFLSISLYTFEINIRYAAILGYVGAGGIGLILNEKLGWREYDKAGMVLVMLFVTVMIIENTSRYLRKRLT